jgi:hypothetical protein
MTKYDLLLSRVRWLESRMRAMEAAQVRRRSKRVPAPRPTNAVVAGREALWAKYVMLEMRFGHGRCRLTKLSFAVRHRQNPSEFCRWFSATDRRGVPADSGPDLRFRQALNDAIAELEARARGGDRKSTTTMLVDSHGKITGSQFSAARLQ